MVDLKGSGLEFSIFSCNAETKLSTKMLRWKKKVRVRREEAREEGYENFSVVDKRTGETAPFLSRREFL